MKLLGSISLKKSILRLTGITIFAGILWYVDLVKIFAVLRDGSATYILLGFSMIGPLAYVRSFRWNLIKKTLDINLPIRNSFFYQLVGQMSFLTPGKAGELIKAVYLHKRGHTFSRSVFSVFLDRLFDLVTVSTIALSSIIFYFTNIKGRFVLLSAGITVPLSFIILFTVIRHTRILNLIQHVFSGILSDTWESIDILNSVRDYFENFKLRDAIKFIGLSLAAYLIQVLRILLLAQSLNIPVSFVYLFGVVALMSLGNILPISISGLGTRDAVFVYFLGMIGISAEEALGLSILVLLNIVLNMLIGTLLFTISPPAENNSKTNIEK